MQIIYVCYAGKICGKSCFLQVAEWQTRICLICAGEDGIKETYN